MGADQMPGDEIVTVAVEGAVGVVTLRPQALTRAAKEQLLDGLRRLAAGRLAAGPTLAYAEAEKAIAAAALPELPDVLAAEHAAQARLGQTDDHKAAVAAFLAKKRPEFRAR